MLDYYRARFRVLNPKRRPISSTFTGRNAVEMPAALRRTCWTAWILAGFALMAAAAGAPPDRVVHRPLDVPDLLLVWVAVQIAMVPVTFTLAAAFSERQTWSRPLLIALVVASCAALLQRGLVLPAAVASAATLALTAHLYGAQIPRAYYAHLRGEVIVRVELSDLRCPVFVGFYASGMGIVLGAVLGGWIVAWHVAEHVAPGSRVNDTYAIVLGAFLGAIVLGVLGRVLGDGLAACWERHARTH